MNKKHKGLAPRPLKDVTWIDELSELSPKQLEELGLKFKPNIQKATVEAGPFHIPEDAAKLGKHVAVVMGARNFPSIMESIRHLQEIEADCPRPGQMLDGYEVIGGMWVEDHYIVKLKPRRK